MSENERLRWQLERNWQKSIMTLVKLIKMEDPYTRGHSEKISRGSKIIARKLSLNEKQPEEIRPDIKGKGNNH